MSIMFVIRTLADVLISVVVWLVRCHEQEFGDENDDDDDDEREVILMAMIMIIRQMRATKLHHSLR